MSALTHISVENRFDVATGSLRVFAVLLFAIWLTAMAVFFWFFEGRSLQESANLRLVSFDMKAMPAAPAQGRLAVMYFLAGDCLCERGALREIQDLQKRYGASLRQWASIGDRVSSAALPASVGVLSAAQSAQWREHVPGFPAAAIWDASGKLVYFGPLASSIDCGTSGTYVAANLMRLSQGRTTAPAVEEVAGCLCPPRHLPS